MKLFEMDMDDAETKVMLAWQEDVKKAYPKIANKLKFMARSERGVHTISAEIPGQDRSYGVFNADTGKGVVLESKE